MKAVVLCLVLVLSFGQSLSFDQDLEAEWLDFRASHEKSYRDLGEEQLRKQIFKQNKEIIDQHNLRYAAGEETFEMGINQFSDLTSMEFETLVLGRLNMTDVDDMTDIDMIYDPQDSEPIPDSVDWREKGAVTAVKNQGKCGSCWAFAAVGTLEGQNFRKTGKLVELSEQNLMDCSSRNHGCNGGTARRALKYIKKNHGIDTAASYPYEPHQGKCQFKKENVGATVRKVVRVRPKSEEVLKKAVARIGPIAVSIEATHLHHYHQGVLRKTCHKRSNHAVLVVGYGHDSQGGDYWLVKNSWGSRFGESGYVRMARNMENMCFIANRGVYPVV